MNYIIDELIKRTSIWFSVINCTDENSMKRVSIVSAILEKCQIVRKFYEQLYPGIR